MGSSSSQTGAAYRTVTNAAARPRLNMSADPIWSLTDTTVTKALNGDFSNCYTDFVQIAGTSTGRIPNYQTCEKIIMPVGGVCHLYHDYSITDKFNMSFTWCATTNDDANLTLDLKVPTVIKLLGASQCLWLLGLWLTYRLCLLLQCGGRHGQSISDLFFRLLMPAWEQHPAAPTILSPRPTCITLPAATVPELSAGLLPTRA